MGWDLLRHDRAPEVRPSAAETARFDLSFARVEVAETPAAPEHLFALIRGLRESDADVVVVRFPQRLVTWNAELLYSGRDLLQADTLVYWRLRVGRGRRLDVAEVGAAVESGLAPAEVSGFVAEVFTGYDNHYAADPLLSAHAAITGYQEWAVGSATTTAPVTLRERRTGDLVALATVARASDHLEIELAGVRPAWQGRGVYNALLAGCEDVAADAGVPDLVISTQAHNVNVQRAWARYGFEPVATFTTLHAVRRGLLTPRPVH